MSTLKAVAKLADVSSWTVSKVLSGEAEHAKISADCAQRVLNAAKKLHYSPNRQARMLREGRSAVIGVLMGGKAQDEYWSSFGGILVAGMDQGIRARGYDTLMIGAAANDSVAGVAAQYFAEKRIDGLLIPEHFCPHPFPSSLLKSPGPVVLAGCDGPDSVSTVTLDDAPGIRAAVVHLAELGRRRVLWLSFATSTNSHSSLSVRRDAFWSAVKELQLEGDELLFEMPRVTCAALSTEAVRKSRDVCMAAWRQISSSNGVVCYNERVALGLYAAANHAGVAIPEALAVVGFDDLVASVVWPPMTTVSHCLSEIGTKSAELACELLAAPDRWPAKCAPRVKIPATLIVRESTVSGMRDPR